MGFALSCQVKEDARLIAQALNGIEDGPQIGHRYRGQGRVFGLEDRDETARSCRMVRDWCIWCSSWWIRHEVWSSPSHQANTIMQSPSKIRPLLKILLQAMKAVSDFRTQFSAHDDRSGHPDDLKGNSKQSRFLHVQAAICWRTFHSPSHTLLGEEETIERCSLRAFASLYRDALFALNLESLCQNVVKFYSSILNL